MQDKMTRLKDILAEVADLRRAANLLQWDMQVYMPPGGAETRGDQLGTLSRLAHEKFTSVEMGELLRELKANGTGFKAESDDARIIDMTSISYDKQIKVPAAWVAEFASVTTVAQSVWAEAKSHSDFNKFRPYLEKIVSLIKEFAGFFAPYTHIYDPLLDGFEPGMKTAEVQRIFENLRPQQVALIDAIRSKPQVRADFLHKKYDEESQWSYAVHVLKDIGYNFTEGRLDSSVHPFTTEMGHGDIRITTKIVPDYFSAGFFSCMHEGGHALYEQGVPKSLYRTGLDEGASMAIHESQSRLWENLVGRSLPFWQHYYPLLKKSFPSVLQDVNLETFYHGINRVEPSLIRVEADEATYNLHIMLRLELEIGLVEGSLAVEDLPSIWNEKMKAYLGIQPQNNAEGVLQDVHWSDGLFGYFPTYALGNIISAQLWEHISQDIADLDEQISRAHFGGLLKWLRTRLHHLGARYEPQDTLQRAIGERIDPQPYLRYLQKKFGQIYNL